MNNEFLSNKNDKDISKKILDHEKERLQSIS